VIGFPLLAVNHAYLLYQDRQLTNLRSALYLADILFRRPGILSGVLRHYLPYYRPDFHPWDDDNREVIRVWKHEFEKSGDVRLAYQALRQAKGRPDRLPAA
jgi:predicted metal-dependent hydrolase